MGSSARTLARLVAPLFVHPGLFARCPHPCTTHLSLPPSCRRSYVANSEMCQFPLVAAELAEAGLSSFRFDHACAIRSRSERQGPFLIGNHEDEARTAAVLVWCWLVWQCPMLLCGSCGHVLPADTALFDIAVWQHSAAEGAIASHAACSASSG